MFKFDGNEMSWSMTLIATTLHGPDRYFCGASDSRGAEETRRAMGLGAGVYFDKLPAASPFICAGILRKEVCQRSSWRLQF